MRRLRVLRGLARHEMTGDQPSESSRDSKSWSDSNPNVKDKPADYSGGFNMECKRLKTGGHKPSTGTGKDKRMKVRDRKSGVAFLDVR